MRTWTTIVQTTSCGTLPYRYVNKNDIEFLLVRQTKTTDSWGIPKGHIEPGETLEQCALRETREETGLIVTLGLRLPDVICKWELGQKTVSSWLSLVDAGDDAVIRTDDPECEVSDVKWFKIGKLPKTHLYQRLIFRAAAGELQIPTTKSAIEVYGDALNYVHSYAGHVDDWKKIKVQLMLRLPSHLRAAFARRHEITKAQQINDFELKMIKKWESLTGRPVILRPDVTKVDP